jgi:hypothetical protein
MTPGRRNFLLALAASGAATTAAVMPKQPATSRSHPRTDRRATGGYQASAHVAKYYRTAKV